MTAALSLTQVLESARRLGIELDEEEAHRWLDALTAPPDGATIVVDKESGIFGHHITMLDFSPADLARLRRLGQLVELEDEPGRIESAIALSGSSAQSRIQSYPGDADFFERVNIYAETREEACAILARALLQKALQTERGETYQLIEVKFGSYPEPMIRHGELHAAGTPVSWSPSEVAEGRIQGSRPDGSPLTVRWTDLANQPGWCKLDWVVVDPERRTLANASNMLDVTWEAPDGTITPLDGYLDPYFQEVYLNATEIPIFGKLSQFVSDNALDDYVKALEKEVAKYLTREVNYGKAAKRMYNIFRLTGRYEEALFLRELFDEPAALLYQVWSLIRTIDDCFQPGSSISVEDVMLQADELIMAVVNTLEGEAESEIVRVLLTLRNSLGRQERGRSLNRECEAARAEVIALVNTFFLEGLSSLPTIRAYMDGMME